MPKKEKRIRVDSLLKSRIKATRKPPGVVVGLIEAYRDQRNKARESSIQKDSLKAANDSLQRVIIELKAKQK